MNEHRRSWRLWSLVLKIWRLCRGGLQPRFGFEFVPVRTFWWRPWRPFYILNIIDKRKNKKEHFCSSGSSGNTRGYTASNLTTTEGLMTWSSEVFRKFLRHVVKWKSCKDRKLKEVLCVVFWSLKKTRKSVCVFFTTFCNSSLTYTTYKPSHRSHTIIPLSNHHTIIIPKSHNLRNIYVFILSHTERDEHAHVLRNQSIHRQKYRSTSKLTLIVRKWKRRRKIVTPNIHPERRRKCVRESLCFLCWAKNTRYFFSRVPYEILA